MGSPVWVAWNDEGDAKMGRHGGYTPLCDGKRAQAHDRIRVTGGAACRMCAQCAQCAQCAKEGKRLGWILAPPGL